MKNLNSKKLITLLWINYGIFVLAFFILGSLGEKYRMILWMNFILDVILCIGSATLNVILFLPRYPYSKWGKAGLLLITLFLSAFTYYAFIMPENGMTPLLFS